MKVISDRCLVTAFLHNRQGLSSNLRYQPSVAGPDFWGHSKNDPNQPDPPAPPLYNSCVTNTAELPVWDGEDARYH
jgi:hypothetical protein